MHLLIFLEHWTSQPIKQCVCVLTSEYAIIICLLSALLAAVWRSLPSCKANLKLIECVPNFVYCFASSICFFAQSGPSKHNHTIPTHTHTHTYHPFAFSLCAFFSSFLPNFIVFTILPIYCFPSMGATKCIFFLLCFLAFTIIIIVLSQFGRLIVYVLFCHRKDG